MGILHQGKWRHANEIDNSGAFIRTASTFIGAEKMDIRESAGRYTLIASKSCPWSHRTTIVRVLKGLENHIPLHYAGGPRVEGYALKGGELWQVPGSDKKIRHLHELYTLSDPDYTGKATIPVMWDSQEQKIISNESSDIARALDIVPFRNGPYDFTLVPDLWRDQIDQANTMIYNGLNNAVYQAGFAQSQSAYEDAVNRVFNTLDGLEDRMQHSRYYFGDVQCETDWRIFPTLCRFDAIYHILFKCSKKRVVDYPALWAYARDLYQTRAIAGTVDFEVMQTASYLNDDQGENPIVAILPDMDWNAPHDRESIAQQKNHEIRSGEDLS